MFGYINKAGFKEYTVKNGENAGKKFKMFEFKVDAIVDEKRGIVKEMRGKMSEQYAKEYFAYCGVDIHDCLDKRVRLTLQRRVYDIGQDGKRKVCEEIKFLNFIDANDNPIIMRR